MMLGRTIPCFDQYMYKKSFEGKPWLFRDFDLIEFYQVSEPKLNELLLLFQAGLYEFKWEETEFDMADHNKLLEDTAEEVKTIRAEQAKAQEEMTAAESESLAKWREEKAQGKVDEGALDALLSGERTVARYDRAHRR